MKMEMIDLTIEIQSPVHIGCDDVFDLTDFYIDDKTNDEAIVIYDKDKFIQKLENQKKIDEFLRIIKNNNLTNIADFINNNAKGLEGHRIKAAKDIIERYKECLKGKGFNKFEIRRTIHNNNTPYIPGSSLKGAFKTAYIEMEINNHPNFTLPRKTIIRNGKKIEVNDYDSTKMISILLNLSNGKNKFFSDPFSLIKFSDFMPENEVKTEIKVACNFNKQNKSLSKNGTLYQFIEVITSGKFKGSVTIFDMSEYKNIRYINKPITWDDLVKSAKRFWNKLNESVNNNEIFIRIGKFCGAENVTIRDRKIKTKNGGWTNQTKTEWLCGNKRKDNYDNCSMFGKIRICF